MGGAREAARLTCGANQDSSYCAEERLLLLLVPHRPPLPPPPALLPRRPLPSRGEGVGVGVGEAVDALNADDLPGGGKPACWGGLAAAEAGGGDGRSGRCGGGCCGAG